MTAAKNSAYAFAAEVDRLINDLNNEEFHRKIGRSKQLREELFPLSRLALFLKLPGLEVEVEAFENSGPADGHIRITGFCQREFEVQITYAGYEEADALRAELFASQGFAPDAGGIRREKKSRNIVATMAAVDHDEHISRMSAAIMNQFGKKALKPYTQGTVLLVAFEEVKLYGRSAWSSLFSAIAEAGGMAVSQFGEIYLFNGATNEIQRVA
jgi:hypothetical protein